MKKPILWTFILPLWLAMMVLASIVFRSGVVDGLTVLGLTPLLPLSIRAACLWLSILGVGGFGLVVFGVLWGLRLLFPALRRLPIFDYLLLGWLPGVGLVLSVWRVFFAYGNADWIARCEPVLVSVGTILALTGTGAVSLRLVGRILTPLQPSPARAEGVSLCVYLIQTNLIGAVTLSILLYILALLGLWQPVVLWGLVSFLSAMGLLVIRRDLSTLEPAGEKGLCWNHEILLTGALFLVLTTSALLATLPPDDSDELRYHLAIPKRYLEHQGWVEIPGQTFSHFPLGMEMLFALPLSLDWARPLEARLSLVGGGKIIHLWFFILCLMTLFQWGRERVVRDLSGSGIDSTAVPPPWGVWFLATISFAPVLASWAFVDFGSAFGWLASAFFIWKQLTSISAEEEPARTRGWSGDAIIFYACLAVGWGMMVKYTGLAWWVILGVIGGGLLWSAGQLKVRRVLMYALIPPVLMSPWLVHNWLSTGNPFSPLLSGLFGGGFTPVQKAFYDWHAGMKGHLNFFWDYPLVIKLADLLFLPLRATLSPEEFEYNPLGGLLLSLLPLGLLGGSHLRRDKSPRGIVLIVFLVIGIFFFWALSYRDTRFAIPLWAILAMGIGMGIDKELRFFRQSPEWKANRLGWGLAVLVVVWGVGQCDEAFLRCFRFSEAILLKDHPDTYLTRPDRLPVVATIREVETLRAREGNSKPPLLLLGQEQSFYFDSPLQGNDYFDGPGLAPLARDATSVVAISSQILKMGYRWIWLNRETLEANGFNLIQGDLFTTDPALALSHLATFRAKEEGGLTPEDLEEWNVSVSENAAFRRMHTWLVCHPGFREVPLNSIPEEDRPLCSFYGDWLKWEEMKGVSVKDLPRRKVSLLVAE